jgi:formylglycine-generating enzyme required for sulfatase activity/serine/threonine protein kinase
MKECPSCHRCFQDQVNHCPSDGEYLKFLLTLDTLLDERYLLERKLGQGGMGLVFKAHHKFIKTQHAIKIILPDLVGNDPSLVARFRQEAMAAAAIRHPNTVSVTDYGILGDTMPYLVMEFVEGRSLHDVLVQEKRLSATEAVEIMLAVCAGVAAAHRQGIVHRDLKPLNIMLRRGEPPGESVKVLDFGLAKIKSGELLGSLVAAQTQGMMGSPFYMAPEQWHDEEIDVRADIYSLGVILYQMLAGDVPFKGKSIPSIMNMHLNAAPVPLSERGIEVPELLERAVQHALEKDPAKRPQTVEEFVAELRAAVPELNGAALAREPGMQTVQIGPIDTAGLSDKKGFETGAQDDSADILKTIASTPDALGSNAPEGEPGHVGMNTVSDSSAALDSGDGRTPRGADTARQQPVETVGPFGGTPVRVSSEEALTEPLPEAFDTQRAREELLRREEQERQRRETEERAAALAAQQQAARQQQELQQAKQQPANAQYAPHVAQAPGAVAHAPSRVLPIVIGALVALALLVGIAGVGIYVIRRGITTNNNVTANTNANKGANTNAGDNTNAGSNSNTDANTNVNSNSGTNHTVADLVQLPGGTFKMGRDDVPPITDELKALRAPYLLWMYNQWPAHSVNVKPFAIDRTEVTNAEYAGFVKETGHQPPPGIWDGDHPKAGEEQLPVTNVSYDDALAFAAWRSRRDSATYRLPTEEEWEFAARGGDSSRKYPWGNAWEEGRANIGMDSIRPVASFPQGNTPQGIADMIGNVWEWTGSKASMYEGNDKTKLDPADRGKMVVRGGAFASRPDGDEPVTVTSRRWLPHDLRDRVLGFRLVRVGP